MKSARLLWLIMRVVVGGAGLVWVFSSSVVAADALSAPPSDPDPHVVHWADPEAGNPLTESFFPEDYGASQQNWDATQDEEGVLYIANTDGVLTFDGARWELYPVENRSIVRGVALGADGHIYVGAQNEFGRLEPDEQGALQYVSMRNKLPDDLEDISDIWNVEAAGDAVYFLTYDMVFWWCTQTDTVHTKASPPHTFFHPLQIIRDVAHVHEASTSVLSIQEDALTTEIPDTLLADRRVRGMAEWEEDGLLLSTMTGAFYTWHEGALSPFSVDFADAIDDEALPYGLHRLHDGTYVLTTIGSGAFFFDTEGTLVRHFEGNDFPVLGVHEDAGGGVWLLLDGMLKRLDWDAPLSTFTPGDYAETITGVVRFNGQIIASTNHGMAYLDTLASGTSATLVRSEPQRQIWDLHLDGDQLIAGAALDLFSWTAPNTYTSIHQHTDHAFRVTAVPTAPHQLFVSSSEGLLRYARDPDGTTWQYRDTPIDEINNLSRQVWADDYTLWIGSRYSGVLRLTVDDDGEIVEVERFDEDAGVPSEHVMPFAFGDTVLFSTETGALQFDAETEQFDDVQGPPYRGTGENQRIMFDNDGTGRWWGHAGNEFGWWSYDNDTSEWMWQALSLQRFGGDVVQSVLSEGDVTWIATNRQLIRYQPGADTPPTPRVQIRAITTLPDDASLYGAHGPAEPSIPFATNSIRVRYAAPSFTEAGTTAYRVRLLGLDDGWSDWSNSASRDFTNLAPGSYTFEVQARTARGYTTEAAQYAFTIVPPWYRTGWAYAIYLLLGLTGLYGLFQWRTAALRKRQADLEKRIDDRTAEIRAKNEQLATQAEKLASLDEAKSRFFANISHELRTPLTLILGPVHQLLEQQTVQQDDSIRAPLTVVRQSTQKLFRMVQQLLRLTQIESDTLPLNVQQCLLGAEMARYASAFASVAEQKEITYRVTHTRPPEDALPAYADLEHIEHVVANLVSNALKFTPAEGSITVSVIETSERTQLIVEDTGIGISKSNQSTIFERFVQADDSRTRSHEGVGIGLALTRDLVQRHGGTVTVSSRPGKGSTFTVELPRGKAPFSESDLDTAAKATSSADSSAVWHDTNIADRVEANIPFTVSPSRHQMARDWAESGDSSAHATEQVAPVPTTTPRVLVVDDNADVREYIRSILEEEFRVMEAASGSDALKKAQRHLPDIILADVMMPGMDGYELTKALRQDSETAAIPVIMVTARAQDEHEIEGLSQGVQDYITKPFTPRILQMRVRGVLQWTQRLRRRLRAEIQQATHQEEVAPASAEEETAHNDADASTQRSAFEEKMRAVIRKRLPDPDFGVEEVAQALAMSRTTLYRHARAHDAPTPATLIRTMRMEMAYQLLSNHEGTVTEVAYAVGYESLSAFSDQFRAHFGHPPSQLTKNITSSP